MTTPKEMCIRDRPYSKYNLKVEAEGYEPIEVSGSEILSGEISRQKIKLRPISDGNYEDVVIPDHTLFGNCLLYTSRCV